MQLAFGGVVFEFNSATPLGLPKFAVAVDPSAPEPLPTIARVRCELRESAVAPVGDSSLDIRCDWRGVEGTLRSPCGVGGLVYEGSATYRAIMAFGGSRSSADSVLMSIAAPILAREGAVLLHAAVIEVDARAIALIGPSGAGKSTAGTLVNDARAVALDRASLVQHNGQWWLWALPGGQPGSLPIASSGKLVLPLGAVLRILRGAQRTELRSLDPFQALTYLREASYACLGTSTEQAILDRLTALMAGVDVSALYTVLSSPIALGARRPLVA